MANAAPKPSSRPENGIAAASVLRGLLLWGAACLLIYASLHSGGHTTFDLHAGATNIHFDIGPTLLGTGSLLLYLLDLKFSKSGHRRAN
jgi:hypothetical protein